VFVVACDSSRLWAALSATRLSTPRLRGARRAWRAHRCAAGSAGFSAAVAAASGLEDAAAGALYAARQQLRLGQPGRMRLLQAAAASRTLRQVD
jgi:hypothetical protein